MAKKRDSKSRAQVVTPRARRIINPRNPRRRFLSIREIYHAVTAFLKPVTVVVGLVVLIVGYNVLAGSQAFRLHRVVVSDAAGPLRDEVEQVVLRAVGQTGLLDADLGALRQRVEEIARVRTAVVSRMLPDGIFVRVVERQPVVLLRRESGPRAGKLVWLDDEAVEMCEFSELKSGQGVPPIAKGFSEGLRSQAMVAEDRERVSLYKQLQREFSQEPDLWNLIDQIDLTFTKDVNLHLAHPPVMIHVGSIDFRPRFERALEVLRSVQQGDSELLSKYRVQDAGRLIQNASNINFIDAVRSERIVVNFDSPGAQKAARQEQKKK